MSLFFETSRQAVVFLAFVPFGFALMLLLSLLKRAGHFRALLDVLCLLLAALAYLGMLVVTRDEGLRLYQLLAMASGALLYTLGVRRLCRLASRLFKSCRAKKADKSFR